MGKNKERNAETRDHAIIIIVLCSLSELIFVENEILKLRQSKITVNELIICSLFAALIAIGAFIKVPIPAVPFTLQFLFTNLAGLLLGKRLAAITIGVYIAIGLLGLPVFTSGGGIGYITQPTFGYIIGFLMGSFVAGYIVQKLKTSVIKTFLIAGFANLIVVYIIGMVYYYFIANYYIGSPIGIGALIWYCFILAVPGDIVLCFISAVFGKRLLPLLKRNIIKGKVSK